LLFDRADSLSAGPPGEYGLGGAGRSADPRASGTSPTSTVVAPELPASKPAPAPPPTKPKGPSSPPRVLNWSEPPYPDAARRQGAEGTTTLRITVTTDGRPTCIGLARSSGRGDLDQAAMEHVTKLRFEPARKEGEQIAMTISFKVKFRLVES
jgi:periplasmic protein TonB